MGTRRQAAGRVGRRADQSRNDDQSRLSVCEAQIRRYEAQLHEITATVAGIASAAEALPLVAPERRPDFEAMMFAELRRLQRVVAGRPEGTPQEMDIDEVVAPLVTVHRARGCAVGWVTSGLTARGNADVVSEALNVLLDNAAHHGAADSIQVEARRRADRIEILVTDHGPGVETDLRGELFAWGHQRPGSAGRGIGLAVARERLREWNGDLRAHHDGATTFVIDLPTSSLREDGREAAGARPSLVR